MTEPDFWTDSSTAKSVIEQANALRSVVNPFQSLARALDDAGVMLDLAESEEQPDHRQEALDQTAGDLARIEQMFSRLEAASLLNGKFDHNNAYVSLHAGAGGTEACDWAEMLYRMYRRYCEDHGFEVTPLDILAGDEAGIKYVTFLVAGESAYGYLSAERGVHRLVRISPFDSNKRRHTSFASLDVVAEIDDDEEISINEADIRVDTYRASGAGGQHVNKTDSAIRLTHMPTGIVVACQSERSQHMNRAKAYKLLRSRLYEYYQDLKRKELEKFYGEKGEIAWGRQIRSYVLQPYTLVKDHRTDFETGNVSAVLEGGLDAFIEAYLKHRRAIESAGSDPGMKEVKGQ